MIFPPGTSFQSAKALRDILLVEYQNILKSSVPLDPNWFELRRSQATTAETTARSTTPLTGGTTILGPPKVSLDEATVRQILKGKPFKELGGGAQARVLRAEDTGVSFVAKIVRNREETQEILISWSGDADPTGIQDWVDRVDSGKARGEALFKERLDHSKGIYHTLMLQDVDILVSINEEQHLIRRDRVDIQAGATWVLGPYLQHLYKSGEKQKIYDVLNAVIRVSQEELWAYGVFDLASSAAVNWGVEVNAAGELVAVGLFDFGELVSDPDLVKEHGILFADFWKRDWAILDAVHPSKMSIAYLTDIEIAQWFFDRIVEEFTPEKLHQFWETKLFQGSTEEIGDMIPSRWLLP